jgi:hypothetical protein
VSRGVSCSCQSAVVGLAKVSMADHVIGHRGDDVVQTVVDVQGSGLRSGGFIAVLDCRRYGQML